MKRDSMRRRLGPRCQRQKGAVEGPRASAEMWPALSCRSLCCVERGWEQGGCCDGASPSGSSVPGILQARILAWVAVPFSRGFSRPRDRSQVSLIADSLPSEPTGKPKNTEVGSLSLLQGIFPTQELSYGLLYCRQILYQLSHQGSPEELQLSPSSTTPGCLTLGRALRCRDLIPRGS